MVIEIPLQPVANQEIAIVIKNQQLVIKIRTLDGASDRQYFSLSLAGTVICENVLIVDGAPIVQAPYLGLIGDFASVDVSGDDPPLYFGWGSRWILVWSDGQ